MISSKILVQSAAAGLMAGAILTSPIFVLGPEDSALKTTTPCPSKVEYKRVESKRDARANQPSARYEHPTLRAAPQHAQLSARKAAQLRQRSLEDRNRAANQALANLNKAYEHSKAEQLGAETAHSVTVHSMATQEATRVWDKGFGLTRCKGEKRGMCVRSHNLIIRLEEER
jgi:hypothetical protein